MDIASVRCLANGNPLRGLVCTDTDFDNAVHIGQHLLGYTLHIYERLGQRQNSQSPITELSKAEQIEEVYDCYNKNMSVIETALQVFGNEKKRGTVYNWIKQYCKTA